MHFNFCFSLYYFLTSLIFAESKFHTYIARQPLRSSSEAWKRLESSDADVPIPTEMAAWVAGDEQKQLMEAAKAATAKEPAAATA